MVEYITNSDFIGYVDLSERVTAVTFYDDEHEEWIQRTVTIADILDSVCENYTVLPSAQPELPIKQKCTICPHCDNCDVNDDGTISQPEPKWIPCSKPPKESGTYIVTAHDGIDKRVTFVKYQKTLKRWDLTGARAYWRILAYKPLPEPWRGEEHVTN